MEGGGGASLELVGYGVKIENPCSGEHRTQHESCLRAFGPASALYEMPKLPSALDTDAATRMVNSFPTNETLWERYAEIRAEGLRTADGGAAGTEFSIAKTAMQWTKVPASLGKNVSITTSCRRFSMR